MQTRLLFAIIFAFGVQQFTYAAKRPNILIYVADDQYLASVGCYGAEPSQTPNIDQLATEGARFTRCFTPSAICTPNRGILLSGMYPLRNGAHPNHSGFFDGVRSLPNYMKAAGYRACIVGKDGIQKPSDLYHWEFRIDKSKDRVPGATEEKHSRHRKTNFEEVTNFLGSEDDRPFCIFHAASLPHGPELNAIPNGLSGYDASNYYMDYELGVYLDLLKKHQLDDNTLVIYLNDNEAQQKRTKNLLYDTGVRIPMVIRWPNHIQPGTTNDTMVSTVDMLPTLLDIIDADIPKDGKQMDGVSMQDVWTGKSDKLREELFFSYTGVIVNDSGRNEIPFPIRGIRTERYKYIRYLNHQIAHPKFKGEKFPAEELFDLQQDPSEQTNLIGATDHADVKSKLSKRIDEWMVEMGDEGIKSELDALRRHPRTKEKKDKATRGVSEAKPAPPGPKRVGAEDSSLTLGVEKSDRERPNVLFIMSDDQGWGDTGYQGHPVVKTPHLDAMAAAGMKLNRFYAQSPNCSPTRGSVLTGRHAYRCGVWKSKGKENWRSTEITLAELLKPEGYRTGMFGKWHFLSPSKVSKDKKRFTRDNTNVDRPWKDDGREYNLVLPWEEGFDTVFCTFNGVPAFNPLNVPVQPDIADLKGKTTGEPWGIPFYLKKPGQDVEEIATGIEGRTPKILVDAATEFIRDAASNDERFVAYVWFYTPHVPVVSSPKCRAMYPDENYHKQHWYGVLTAMDEQVGRLRQTLRDLNIHENTIVWFASDNGPAPKQHGSTGGLRGAKQTVWEGGVRVPGLVEWPGVIPADSELNEPVVTSDYLPTTLDILGLKEHLPSDRTIDGTSVWPLVCGEQSKRTKPIFFRSLDQAAVIDGNWKWVSDDKGKNYQLFNLKSDRAESTNVKPKHKKIASNLKKQLARWETSWRADLFRDVK